MVRHHRQTCETRALPKRLQTHEWAGTASYPCYPRNPWLKCSHVTGRIIIHAGFAKCGSSSIQAALFHNFDRLQKDGFSLFGKDMRIAHTSADLGVPLWLLEQAREKGEPLAERLSGEIESVRAANGNRIGILSAENLSRPQMAPLLTGLDHRL
jgi:hypothetical protein